MGFPVLESVDEFLRAPCFPLAPVMTDANQLRCHLQKYIYIILCYRFHPTLSSEILLLGGEIVISKHVSSDLIQNSSRAVGVEGARIKSFKSSGGSRKEDLGVKRI